jgi:hypothetical protein
MLTIILSFIAGFFFGIILLSLLTQGRISDLESEIIYLREKLREAEDKKFSKINILKR